MKEEGNFVWVSGKQSFFGDYWYKDKVIKEPNGGRRENCVEMYLTHFGTWNDNCCDCAYKRQFVCERTIHV